MTAPRAHIQFVTGRLQPLERSLPAITGALDGGIDSVQLRDGGAAIAATIKAMKVTRPDDVIRLVVNGEPGVAGTFAMRWLHLPGSWLEGTPPFAKFSRIGISVHSLEEAIEAEGLGADYVTFGNVYETGTHPGRSAQGLATLEDILDRLAIPVLAIGGITHANLADVLATGCAGVVVHAAIADQREPARAASRLVEIAEAAAPPDRPLPAITPLRKKGRQA